MRRAVLLLSIRGGDGGGLARATTAVTPLAAAVYLLISSGRRSVYRPFAQLPRVLYTTARPRRLLQFSERFFVLSSRTRIISLTCTGLRIHRFLGHKNPSHVLHAHTYVKPTRAKRTHTHTHGGALARVVSDGSRRGHKYKLKSKKKQNKII